MVTGLTTNMHHQVAAALKTEGVDLTPDQVARIEALCAEKRAAFAHALNHGRRITPSKC